eukprot:scaffold73_cov252-Pinguiococcus_pyrenoidosus.AAC.21
MALRQAPIHLMRPVEVVQGLFHVDEVAHEVSFPHKEDCPYAGCEHGAHLLGNPQPVQVGQRVVRRIPALLPVMAGASGWPVRRMNGIHHVCSPQESPQSIKSGREVPRALVYSRVVRRDDMQPQPVRRIARIDHVVHHPRADPADGQVALR